MHEVMLSNDAMRSASIELGFLGAPIQVRCAIYMRYILFQMHS